MRYIRTTNGKIFDTEYEPDAFKYNFNPKFIIDDNNLIVYDKEFRERIANHGEIIKQADTIEELCDVFVYVDDGCDPEVSVELDLMQTSTTIIYGAILTELGLKYVAKMNEKGELELLWIKN